MIFFIEYKPMKNPPGLLFESRLEVDYPSKLAKWDDPIVKVEEDFMGKLKVETEKRVYIQEGYRDSK